MANLIKQSDVLIRLHNLMGKRVAPGGTDDDLKRYCQDAFDYAWRYFRWRWSIKSGSTDGTGVLPDDFDLDGWFSEAENYDAVWDDSLQKLVLSPLGALDFTYQIAPPTLNDEAGVPFPSAMAVAVGALLFAKQGENPTRADIQQEWDEWHSLLDRLAGRSYNNKPRRPQHYLDRAGTYVGDVGA